MQTALVERYIHLYLGGGKEVSECVDTVEREVVFLAQLFQPGIRCVDMHRATVSSSEQPFGIIPLCAHLFDINVTL